MICKNCKETDCWRAPIQMAVDVSFDPDDSGWTMGADYQINGEIDSNDIYCDNCGEKK